MRNELEKKEKRKKGGLREEREEMCRRRADWRGNPHLIQSN
jgi:hypothetical protein